MQQGEVATLARMLLESGHYTGVDIETAGTIAPIPRLVEYVNHFTVSPKLSHSGNDPLRALRPEVLEEFAFLAKRERATFKFVLRSNDDYEEVLKFCKDYDMPHEYVYIMPEGTNSEAILDGACKLATRALREGFHMSLRNHVLIWGDERGV
jgi:organic radical activating enzyme